MYKEKSTGTPSHFLTQRFALYLHIKIVTSLSIATQYIFILYNPISVVTSAVVVVVSRANVREGVIRMIAAALFCAHGNFFDSILAHDLYHYNTTDPIPSRRI